MSKCKPVVVAHTWGLNKSNLATSVISRAPLPRGVSTLRGGAGTVDSRGIVAIEVDSREKVRLVADAYERKISELEQAIMKSRQHHKIAKQDMAHLKQEVAEALKQGADANSRAVKAETELTGCRKSVTSLRAELESSENARQKLVRQENSVRETLERETSLNVSLERSQAMLTKHVAETDSLVQGLREELKSYTEREKVRELDLVKTRALIGQEQQANVVLQERLASLSAEKAFFDDVIRDAQKEKGLMLSDVDKLQADVVNLTKQVHAGQKDAETNLIQNEQLQRELDAARVHASEALTGLKQQMELTTNRHSAELLRLQEELKETRQDKELLLQRCAQLQSQVSGLHGNLVVKDDEIAAATKSGREEVARLKGVLAAMETERNELITKKDLEIEKLTLAIGCLTEEKAALLADLHTVQLDLKGVQSAHRQLERTNRTLLDKAAEHDLQKKSLDGLERALCEATEQCTCLSYNNGLLQGELARLKTELAQLDGVREDSAQQRKTTAAVEARNATLHADLASDRALVHRLRSELAHAQSAAERRDKDFALAIVARDQALVDKRDSLEALKELEKSHGEASANLEASLSRSKQDVQKLTSTLDSLTQSHSHLQSLLNASQSKLGKKESSLRYALQENARFSAELESLRRESAELSEKLRRSAEEREEALQPMRNEAERKGEELARMGGVVETLIRCNEELRSKVVVMKTEAAKCVEVMGDLKRAKASEADDFTIQLKRLQRRIEEQNLQLDELRAKESEWKQVLKELNKLESENAELCRENQELLCRLEPSCFKNRQLGTAYSANTRNTGKICTGNDWDRASAMMLELGVDWDPCSLISSQLTEAPASLVWTAGGFEKESLTGTRSELCVKPQMSKSDRLLKKLEQVRQAKLS